MEKKLAGLVGAIAALGTLDAAAAAPVSQAPMPSLKANSFAELLEPIPNAAEVLQLVDSQEPPVADEGQVVQVQYHHHHHHHHHAYWRRRVYVRPPWWYHHHHHHHHHHFYHHHHHSFYRY